MYQLFTKRTGSLSAGFFCLFLLVFLNGCKEPYKNEGIFEKPEEPVELGDPKITSITPEEGAPLSIFTIDGENFSTNVEENQVSINGLVAKVVAANSTSMQVEVPENAETGTVEVRVLDKSVTGPVFTVLAPSIIVYISETFAGAPNVKGYVNGHRLGSQFDVPEGLAFDSKGNLFVADRDNHVIRKIDTDGQVTLFAGTVGEKGYADGAAGAAKFASPLKLDIDKDDNLYIADRDNHVIRKIAPDGTVSTLAGKAGTKGFDNGKGSAATFSTPIDVAVDDNGNVYVVESGNNCVRKITADGTVSTLAGNGSRSHADGAGEAAAFADPSGIAVGPEGNLFVADRRNHAIRKVSPAGVVTTIAGSAGSAGYVDGPSNITKFSHPWGIYVSAEGLIYTTDAGNNRVRMMDDQGIWSTIGGGDQGGYQDGNPSLYAYPTDLVVDEATGDVYVADFNNQVIRRIVPTEKTVE